VLATPSSFKSVGIVGGNVGMIIIGIIAMYTMKLQILATKKVTTPVGSYSDLGKAILGVRGKKFVDFCILTSQTGFGIAYLIFIGQQMDQVICFETLYEDCNYKGLYIYIAALILVPICWLRSFKYLAYVSMASNIFLCFASKYQSFPANLSSLFSRRDNGLHHLEP
jgi:amino acid permease